MNMADRNAGKEEETQQQLLPQKGEIMSSSISNIIISRLSVCLSASVSVCLLVYVYDFTEHIIIESNSLLLFSTEAAENYQTIFFALGDWVIVVYVRAD